ASSASAGRLSLALLEGDLRSLALGRLRDLEVLLVGVAHLLGRDRGGELLDARVEHLDIRVVDPARGLDLVLELGELALQLLEVLGGPELRVLLRDDPEASEGLRQ